MAGVGNFISREGYDSLGIGGTYNLPICGGFRAPIQVELNKPPTVGASEQFIDPKFPGDVNVQATATSRPNLKLPTGVRNLFNRNPPLTVGNRISFQTGYDPIYDDARARTAYVTANYKFF